MEIDLRHVAMRGLSRIPVTATAILIACSDASTSVTPTDPVVSTPSVPLSPSPNPPKEFIYIANADGTGAVKLTAGHDASWSPDGSRILFHRNTVPGRGTIYVINADGSNERSLASGDTPSWSPDGSRILFADDGGLEAMNLDGSNQSILLGADFRDDENQALGLAPLRPVFSPDGKRIAFERSTDWTYWPETIFVMNVDGSNLHRVSMNANGDLYAEYDPAWSPDGKSIAFWSVRYGLAIADANGGTPRSVLAEQTFATGLHPAWSPDGSSLAFDVATSDANPTASVIVVSARTGATQRVIPDAYDLSYSPDGKRIAFTTRRLGGSATRRLGGSAARRLGGSAIASRCANLEKEENIRGVVSADLVGERGLELPHRLECGMRGDLIPDG